MDPNWKDTFIAVGNLVTTATMTQGFQYLCHQKMGSLQNQIKNNNEKCHQSSTVQGTKKDVPKASVK
jgi:hypothetical protein